VYPPAQRNMPIRAGIATRQVTARKGYPVRPLVVGRSVHYGATARKLAQDLHPQCTGGCDYDSRDPWFIPIVA
jgi:hypothetical protein